MHILFDLRHELQLACKKTKGSRLLSLSFSHCVLRLLPMFAYTFPICLIRSSFTTLLTGETTCPTPTVPVQLSPSWWGGQTDAVALAGESVTWSAMGYLHRARAAGGSGNEETVTHTHTTGVAAQRGHASEYRKNTRWVAGELSLSHGISQSTVEGRRAPNPWFTPKQTLLLYGEQTAVGAALQLPFPPHC